jgi:hypothetical protein
MNSHVLITAIPVQDMTRPPGILGILAGCCETAGVSYDISDLNLHMYQQLPEEICQQLANDFLNNKFRSADNQQYYQQMCDDYLKVIEQTKPMQVFLLQIFYYVISNKIKLIAK